MKITINYDLLSKTQEAKTGFSLQKTVKHILIKTGVYTALIMTIDSFYSLTPEEVSKNFLKP